MKAVIQLVKKASVEIGGKTQAKIGPGFLILLGVSKRDTKEDACLLAQKIIQLRIMPDEKDKMNFSLLDAKAEALVVSQFTLFADTSKGRRPSFLEAAPPGKAEALYKDFANAMRKAGIKTSTGVFGAFMDVALVNDGPVTIILDTDPD